MNVNMISGLAVLAALLALASLLIFMPIPLKYNFRSLRVRWMTAAMTVSGIGLVTAVFVAILALGVGMDRTLVGTGHPLNLILLRPGSKTETNSMISKKQADDVLSLEGIETDAEGKKLVSPELIVIANLPRKNGKKANIAIRGVGPMARELRGNIALMEGVWLRPGLGELVVGKGAKSRFADLKVGDTPFIRGRSWRIVGVFAADGQAYESELWGDVEDIKTQFKREYSSIVLRARDEAALGRLQRVLKDDKQIELDAKPHIDYYRDQNQGSMMLKALGSVMGFVLSIGAIFGAANTMYAAVASRTREIATMRVLGFSSLAIWISFMLESTLLGLMGGVVGSGLAYLVVDGATTGTANWQTFSDLAFQFRVTPALMLTGAVLAAIVGAVGGFFPAFRASRTTIAQALRGL